MKPNTIKFQDCIEGLKDIESNSVDAFYTDPPFGIDFTKVEGMYNRDKDKVQDGYVEPIGDYYTWCKQWINEMYRVTTDTACGMICSGWSNAHHIMRAAEEAGFTITNQIVWKYQFGVWTTRKFVTSHYVILFLTKHKSKWTFNMECRVKSERTKDGNPNYRDREDVWYIKRPYRTREQKNANTQPEELVMKCLEYITNEGDLVLDPFMGGGTTALCCAKLGRQYLGFEINKNNMRYIERRLREDV